MDLQKDKSMITEIYNGETGGAYNGARYLAKAITSEGKPSLYSSSHEGSQFELEGRGGCLVFSSDSHVGRKDLEQQLVAITHHAWTVGHYLTGSYSAPDNRNYDGRSICVDIAGADLDELIRTAKELSRSFAHDSLLLKDYSSGKVLYMNV